MSLLVLSRFVWALESPRVFEDQALLPLLLRVYTDIYVVVTPAIMGTLIADTSNGSFKFVKALRHEKYHINHILAHNHMGLSILNRYSCNNVDPVFNRI